MAPRRTGRNVVASALLAGLFLGLSQGGFAETRYTVPLEGSPTIGPKNAPVVLVEFLDYQ